MLRHQAPEFRNHENCGVPIIAYHPLGVTGGVYKSTARECEGGEVCVSLTKAVESNMGVSKNNGKTPNHPF